MNLYILLNLLVLAGPLVLSFDKKVAFFKQWRAVFPAILLVVLLYGVWDIWMTAQGIWWFSPHYAGSVHILGLPPGEWLFFICVPYACIFILACVDGYVKDKLLPLPRWLWFALAAVLVALAIIFRARLYSMTNLAAAAIILTVLALLHPATLRSRNFWLAILISYLPFALANGVLTGLPVVLYDDSMNWGIRVGSIPLDDFLYSLSMLVLALGGYRYLRGLQQRRAKVNQ
ncbi:MAG: lycopene cyclase domain-containing protein [Spirochaetes bacterium]|nr:lycopene cyclase domain-containing protein [Spirochaetota bacterium]MBU0955031.1 lycopene cyclase domain-containing protein [Spirochaetota bacterium]